MNSFQNEKENKVSVFCVKVLQRNRIFVLVSVKLTFTEVKALIDCSEYSVQFKSTGGWPRLKFGQFFSFKTITSWERV